MQALLGVYAFAGGETALAQKCLLRARLLMLTVHGEDHPYTATLDVGYNKRQQKHLYKTFLLFQQRPPSVCFLPELPRAGAERRSEREVLNERPQAQHLLLRPCTSAHRSQVRRLLQNPCLKNEGNLCCPCPLSNACLVSCPCSQQLLAQWMCSKGDYRSAMSHEKEALAAFTSMVSILACESST